MGRFGRGTLIAVLVVPFVLGAVLAGAIGLPASGTKTLHVPEGWRAVWEDATIVEDDDVALAWGDLAGDDPLDAPEEIRFDPDRVLDQLQALHDYDVDVLGLEPEGGQAAGRKILVVVDGTWSQGPGAAGSGVLNAVGGGLADGAGAPALTQGAVVDGVGLLRVAPQVLASSLEDPPEPAVPAEPTSLREDPTLVTPPTEVVAGTPWELARGFGEVVQHLLVSGAGGRGLTDPSAATFWSASAAYLASLAVPGEHADVSDLLHGSQLAWGSARQDVGSWLLLQHLAGQHDVSLVRRLWTEAMPDEQPLAAYARLTSSSGTVVNGRVAQYALRAVAADVAGTGGPGAVLTDVDPVLRTRITTPLDAVADDPGHYRVLGAFAPAAYGYNVVELAPAAVGTPVRVRLRGHVEAAPADAAWAVGFVVHGADGIRYSPVTQTADGEVEMIPREGDAQVHLVVVAAPGQVSQPAAGQGFAATPRFPYELRVEGAQVVTTRDVVEGGHAHPNGGGWVDDDARVDPGAWVGPDAVVRGDATVGAKVRLEGRAWVEAGAEVTGSVIVRDSAVVQGTARLTGDLVVGGDAVVGFTCDAGVYTSYRAGATCDAAGQDSDVNATVTPFTAGETALSPQATPTPSPTPTPTPTPSPTPSPTGSPSADAAPSPADDPTSQDVAPPAPVPAGACTARYRVTNRWPGGYQAEVTVTATTDGVEGWAVSWTQPDGVGAPTEVWGATLTSSGGSLRAEDVGWNGWVPEGQSVVFAFQGGADGDGDLREPSLSCSRRG